MHTRFITGESDLGILLLFTLAWRVKVPLRSSPQLAQDSQAQLLVCHHKLDQNLLKLQYHLYQQYLIELFLI